MKVALLFTLLAITYLTTGVRFVSYIGQAGPGWAAPGTNEDFLKYIGVPGYGEGSKGYNILNFAFWVSTSNNGGAAANGAAFDWQNILQRITSSSLRRTLTGSSNPTASQLRAGIKAKYEEAGIKIFISAFGGNDHPMQNGKSATTVANDLAAYAKAYNFDGVDVDWEEGIVGKLGANGGGESWLCTLTNTLRSRLNSNQLISHAPQAPYFRCNANSPGCNYPNGGYVTVNKNCGGNIDFYNIQFYNQGTTRYDTYNELFVSSSGWSTNSAVYQIMSKGVPASKIIVGKHTSGDGSTFVSGSTLKSIFSSAISAGRWNAGFMTWQFYREVTSGSSALIESVKQVNGWGSSVPTTPTTSTTTTPAPTVSTTRATHGNIVITNIDYNTWFYAASISGVSPGYTVTKFEITLSNGAWHTCNLNAARTWYMCERLSSPVSTNAFSVRITAGSRVLTSVGVITSLTKGATFNFGKNFGSSGPTPTATTTKSPTPSGPSPTPRPTASTPRPTPSSGGGGGCTITMRAGSSAWWMSMIITDIPSGVSISSVKMKSKNSLTYVTGTYTSWCSCYVFSLQSEAKFPLTFKMRSSTGQEITGNDIISSYQAGASGKMPSSFSSSYKESDSDGDDDTLSWTVWFAIIVGIIVIIGVCAGFYVYRKRKGGKAYIADSDLAGKDGNATPPKMDTLNEEEVEIDVEMEETETITATNE